MNDEICKYSMMRSKFQAQKDLYDLINVIDRNNLILVEIGSYMGESACFFAHSNKFKEIICIDPWISDHNGKNENSYTNMEQVEQIFNINTSKYKNIKKFKGTIDTFIQSDMFKGIIDKIDIVYIDGLHTYDGCKHDIEICKNILKPKFAFSGHDYTDKIPHVVGVKKAVEEFFVKPDMVFCDNSWIKFV